MSTHSDPFYIAAYESGSVRSDLPVWGSSSENPLCLQDQKIQTVRKEVDSVPGAFQLLNVFDAQECQAFINSAEQLGFTEDAAVSLGRNVRHNMNLNWIVDIEMERLIWSRVERSFCSDSRYFLGSQPLGINQRFRFYRYNKGDYFSYHTNGAWPGSRIIDKRPVMDAFGDRFSLFTFLIFLNDDITGGATQFLVDKAHPDRPAKKIDGSEIVSLRTPAGGVLCFPHGAHPLHCLHASEEVYQGSKYIIRTDVLFSL